MYRFLYMRANINIYENEGKNIQNIINGEL